MAKEILTRKQKKFFDCVSRHARFQSLFYLTDGTALAAFYLRHRYSEDLDFFSEQDVSSEEVITFIRSLKKN